MIEYNVDYYYNLLRIQSQTGRMIADIRWEFIKENLLNDFSVFIERLSVLDYGCGVGFMKAFAPDWAMVDTYDIMPVIQTGIRADKYDLVMLYDVLEHIDWVKKPDRKIENIFKRTKRIVITIPILPQGKDFRTWKHRKTGEHLTRFENKNTVINFFKKRNFECIAMAKNECPPREDIVTFLFKNIRN